MRLAARKQKGIALLAFVAVLSIVTFTIVMGYSISSAKKQILNLSGNQKAYLNDVRGKLVDTYAAHLNTLDADLGWDSVKTGPEILALAGVSPRWGLEAAISPRISKEGVKYRVIAAWLPLDSDVTDDPVLNPDGSFQPCPASTSDCLNRRNFVVVSEGFSLQRANVLKANKQLEQLAANAQSFFKSKVLLDPEHNVSVNYFRPPYIQCSNAITEQLPCLNTPAAIWPAATDGIQNSAGQHITELLGFPNAPLLNPWGKPVEACNGSDCSDATPTLVKWNPAAENAPYSMLFQADTPWGSKYRIYAVQQL